MRKDTELASLPRGPLRGGGQVSRVFLSLFLSLPLIFCSEAAFCFLLRLFPRSKDLGMTAFRSFGSLSASQRLQLSDFLSPQVSRRLLLGFSWSRVVSADSRVPLLLPLCASPGCLVFFPGPCRLREPCAPTLAPPVPRGSLARPWPRSFDPARAAPGEGGTRHGHLPGPLVSDPGALTPRAGFPLPSRELRRPPRPSSRPSQVLTV